MRIKNLFIDSRAVRSLKIDGRPIAFVTEPVASDALCFTAQEAGSTVKLHKVGSASDVNLQTSTNGSSWTPYTVEDVITLANVDDKVYFKAIGSNTKMGNNQFSYRNFVMTGKIAASGNVNSLLEEDEDIARTMSLAGKDFCYNYMFKGCTSLTQAPVLPATTLANSCYSGIFNGCTSLTTAPVLPATTLTERCYDSMFSDCTSLTQAPELPATTLASYCYQYMFLGCTSLTQAPALPATTLANYCYYSMFSNCESLAQAPALPAYTLVDSCYTGMFAGCSQLNYVQVGFDNWAQYATDNWLPNNTGTFRCPQTLIDNTTERSNSTVPASWTMVAV